MKRFIILENDIVISVRYGKSSVYNEIESDTGEVGQQLIKGEFTDIPKEVDNTPTLEDKVDFIYLKNMGVL